MEKNLMEIGETISFKQPNGFVVYEFLRLGFGGKSYLSDNVELKKYDSRKKIKGSGSWILLKNLPEWIEMLEERGFVRTPSK
jgi:hypothetical protein